MKMLTLKKPIKTVVKSYKISEDKKIEKDAEGKEIVTGIRDVLISGLEVAQYETLAEAIQEAGSEEKVVEYLNDSKKADAITPIRVLGASFTTDDSDETIITKAKELVKKFNPFSDRRKTESTKALAERFKEIQTLLSSGADEADIIAMLKSGKL